MNRVKRNAKLLIKLQLFSLGKAGERFVVSILLLLLFDIKWFSSLNY